MARPLRRGPSASLPRGRAIHRHRGSVSLPSIPKKSTTHATPSVDKVPWIISAPRGIRHLLRVSCVCFLSPFRAGSGVRARTSLRILRAYADSIVPPTAQFSEQER
ncbi:hypothetical protein DQ04_10151010 [Trypanosoma grayi]|uniref:hypothetical protein n=1 Tax=Trypanosoma grayi TaxID=71804 RepID=UPI0004F3FE07|nr:hypothetical protein DQ04_10151010 [Trypanosoma grayi]KEG07332.1 hypothetical protein DQ04_10151010 [Trypanosoma grayi]